MAWSPEVATQIERCADRPKDPYTLPYTHKTKGLPCTQGLKTPSAEAEGKANGLGDDGL